MTQKGRAKNKKQKEAKQQRTPKSTPPEPQRRSTRQRNRTAKGMFYDNARRQSESEQEEEEVIVIRKVGKKTSEVKDADSVEVNEPNTIQVDTPRRKSMQLLNQDLTVQDVIDTKDDTVNDAHVVELEFPTSVVSVDTDYVREIHFENKPEELTTNVSVAELGACEAVMSDNVAQAIDHVDKILRAEASHQKFGTDNADPPCDASIKHNTSTLVEAVNKVIETESQTLDTAAAEHCEDEFVAVVETGIKHVVDENVIQPVILNQFTLIMDTESFDNMDAE